MPFEFLIMECKGMDYITWISRNEFPKSIGNIITLRRNVVSAC